MLKQLNRVLKLVGLNLVRAKRRKAPKSEGQRVAEFLDEFLGGKRPPYTREELESASLKCAVNQPGAVQLSDYMGESEWLDTPPVGREVPNPYKTHYVGDDCPGGHRDCFKSPEQPRVEQPNSDNKTSGPTS